MDWHDCKFLESTENLKPLVKARFGREPNSAIAREITACLQQGRLFFEAAASSPLEIRPLQLFYGTVGFAKALITASRNRPLCSLKATHGLKDISHDVGRIERLRVKVQEGGTFQEFNDVVARINRIDGSYIHDGRIEMPCAPSTQIQWMELSLRDILSRIYSLRKRYRSTFGEDSNTDQAYISIDPDKNFSIIFVPDVNPPDLICLKEVVESLRQKYPFLKRLRLYEANLNPREVPELTFINLPAVDEFHEKNFYVSFDNQYRANLESTRQRLPLTESVAPFSGGFSHQSHIIKDVAGQYLSEFCYRYLGLFLLSSLVRYRPEMWMHVISGSVSAQAPADDKALSLIEQFLESSTDIPEMVVQVLNS